MYKTVKTLNINSLMSFVLYYVCLDVVKSLCNFKKKTLFNDKTFFLFIPYFIYNINIDVHVSI